MAEDEQSQSQAKAIQSIADAIKSNGPWVSFIAFCMLCCMWYIFPMFQKVGESHLKTMEVLQESSKEQARSTTEMKDGMLQLKSQSEATIEILKDIHNNTKK